MDELNEELRRIENKSGTILYMALLETFNNFKLFKKPNRVVQITFSTVQVFFKKLLQDIHDSEKREEVRETIEKIAEKFHELFTEPEKP
jgi:hypothetical protein